MMIWKLLILQVLFFGAMVFVLQKFFHGNLIKATGRIELLRKKNLQKEEELRQAHAKFLRDCQDKINLTNQDIAQMRKKAEEEIKVLKQVALSASEEERKSLRSEFEEREKILAVRLNQEAQSRTSAVACDLVKSTFTEPMRRLLHEELCRELLDSLPKALSAQSKLTGSLELCSAFSFSAPEKKNIQSKLAQIFSSSANSNPSFEINEKLDESLVAGFILFVGDQVLDGSLKNRFEKQLKT